MRGIIRQLSIRHISDKQEIFCQFYIMRVVLMPSFSLYIERKVCYTNSHKVTSQSARIQQTVYKGLEIWEKMYQKRNQEKNQKQRKLKRQRELFWGF